jgi:hypothetical protein
MADPKISIKFEATGGKGLKNIIDDLHVANTRLTKGQKAAVEAQKQVILTDEKARQAKDMLRKQARDINAENRNTLQTQKDLQRLQKSRIFLDNKEINNAIKGRDARRSNVLEMKKENAERKKTLNALKQDIIARTKQNKKIEEQEIRTRNLHGTFSVARSKLLLFSFGLTLALDPIRRLVKASSDANEVLNKSSVVFGENMDTVSDWANSLGSAVGRANSTLLEMASSLQDLFVPLGFSRAAAAELSTSLTELAIDVASFSNRIDADVLQDFESAIVGNHKSVRKYGIVITEATLKQEAYNLGLTDTVRELSENEKIQSRLSLITKGSSDAMGDAQRTADEYAQSLVRFNETWKEISENIGSALKPILAFGLGVASDKKKLTSYAVVLGALGLGYALNSRSSKIATNNNAFFGKGVADTASKTKKATFITRAFSKVLRRVPYLGMFLLASELISKIFDLTGAFDNQNKTLEESKDIIEKNANATEKFLGQNEKLIAQQQASENKLKQQLSLLDLELEKMEERSIFLKFMTDVEKDIITASKGRIGGTKNLTEAENDLIFAIRARNLETKIAIERDKQQEKVFDFVSARKRQSFINEIEAAQNSANEQVEINKRLNNNLIREQKKREDDLQITTDRQREIFDLLSAPGFLPIDKEALKAEQEILNQRLTFLVGNLDVETGIKMQIEEGNTELENRQNIVIKLEERFAALTENIRKSAQELLTLSKLDIVGGALGAGLGQLEFDFLNTFENMRTAYDESVEIFGEQGEHLKNAYIQMGADLAVGLVNMQTQAIQAEMNSIKEAGEQRKKELRESRRFQRLSEKQQKEQLDNIDKATSAANAKQFEKQQDMARVGVILDTASAIMKVVRQFPPLGMPFTPIVSAMGIAQLALINSQKPPKAQTGGLVGGRRHSQGGTMIEAEEGEFIVNRDAVSSVGVETMNRINRGGGASQVSVSFTGNVMSDDFIENEAIPKIKEAVRRGSDIGVS